MEVNVRRTILCWRALALFLTLTACAHANAAEFFLYLQCTGKVVVKGKATSADLNLALRDNNMTALIQKSSVLPVGERLRYDVSPVAYSMSFEVPGTESVVLYDWWRAQLFVWQPSLKRVATIRLSIDRQTGGLTGEMLNAQAVQLATLVMRCDAVNEDELPPQKF